MNNKFFNNKIAFTLAEILITLLIIGVISAIVLPTLINDTQDQQYKTAWRSAFATVSQAMSKALQDNAGSIKGLCASDSTSDCLKNTFLPYLSYVKNCTTSISLGNCWTSNAKWMDMSDVTTISGSSVILNNGTSLIFWLNTTNCNSNFGNYLVRCGGAGIDINGLNAPNVVGKDIYFIHILENSIRPYGLNTGIYKDVYVNSCVPSGAEAGKGCAAKYLYN